jgi:hypothetical protein
LLLEVDGAHMQFTLDWFQHEVMEPFLMA